MIKPVIRQALYRHSIIFVFILGAEYLETVKCREYVLALLDIFYDALFLRQSRAYKHAVGHAL